MTRFSKSQRAARFEVVTTMRARTIDFTSFHLSLKRSTLILSYPHAGRPITSSFGAKRIRAADSQLTEMASH
jgi:hypothetical protein